MGLTAAKVAEHDDGLGGVEIGAGGQLRRRGGCDDGIPGGWVGGRLPARTTLGIVDVPRRPLLAMGACLVVLAAAAACSEPSSDIAPPHSSSSPPTSASTSAAAALSVAGDQCVSVSGYTYAQRGDLSVGPFMSEALTVLPTSGPPQAKVWIASLRDGHDAAQLAVTAPNGAIERQVRKSGEAFVSNAKQFYPGGIQLSGSRPYRIDVQVGPDHLCVIADYRIGR